jgi:hypothetical protein
MKQAEFTIKPKTWAVLIILSLLAWFLFGAFVLADTEEPVQETPRIKTLTLPQKCRHLERDPDPETWDPVKEEYPRNLAWENCMGVGPK